MFSVRTERRSAAVLAAAASLALVLAACGDEGDNDDNDAMADTEQTADADPAEPSDDQAAETSQPVDDGDDTDDGDQGDGADDPTDDGSEEETETETGEFIGDGGPSPDVDLPTTPPSDAAMQDGAIDEAIADLAEREGVDPSEITAVGHRAVTWRDGSIGCPSPGGAYTQALVPGEQLALELNGELYSYHRGNENPYEYCADPVVGEGEITGVDS